MNLILKGQVSFEYEALAQSTEGEIPILSPFLCPLLKFWGGTFIFVTFFTVPKRWVQHSISALRISLWFLFPRPRQLPVPPPTPISPNVVELYAILSMISYL